MSSHVDMSRSSTSTKTSSSSPPRSGPSPAASTPSLCRETTQGSENSSPSADASFALEDFVLFPEDDSNQWNPEFEAQYNDLSLMNFNQFPDFDVSYFTSVDVTSSFSGPSSSQSSFSSTDQLADYSHLPNYDHVQPWAYANINSQSVSPVESEGLSAEDLNFFDSFGRPQGDDRVHHTVHLRNAQDNAWNMLSPTANNVYAQEQPEKMTGATHTRHIHEANSSTHLRLADGDTGTMYSPAAAGYAQGDAGTNRGGTHTAHAVRDPSLSHSAVQLGHAQLVSDEQIRDVQEDRRKRNRKLAPGASAPASTSQGSSVLPTSALYSPEGYTEVGLGRTPVIYSAPRPLDPQDSPVINCKPKIDSEAVYRTPSPDVLVSTDTGVSVRSPATVMDVASDTSVVVQLRTPRDASPSIISSRMSSPRSSSRSDAQAHLPSTEIVLPDASRQQHLKHCVVNANVLANANDNTIKSTTAIALQKHAGPSGFGKAHVTKATPSKPTISLLAALVVGLGVPIVAKDLLHSNFIPVFDVLATMFVVCYIASNYSHGACFPTGFPTLTVRLPSSPFPSAYTLRGENIY
jgi:hypothetical protein